MQTTILFFHGYRENKDNIETSKVYDLLREFITANSNDQLCIKFVNWHKDNVPAIIMYNLHVATTCIRNKENFILIGHSAGGNIATTIYNQLQKINLYSKLILINPLIDKTKSKLPQSLLDNLIADYSKVKDSEIVLSLFDDITNWQTANEKLHSNNGINFESQKHKPTYLSELTYKNILQYINKQI